MITPEKLAELASLAEDTASLEDVGEYGYGGEIFPYHVISNWEEVVTAIVAKWEAIR